MSSAHIVEANIRTGVPFIWHYPLLKPHSVIASIGSCFSESVVSVLLDSGFRGRQNPNGIVYNPYSLYDAVQRLDTGYTETDFFEYQGLWHSWKHHGSYSCCDVFEAVKKANVSCRNYLRTLKKADIFIATVSSAVVYRYLPENRIVANCHKVPGNQFQRELLSSESCHACLRALCKKIREWNQKCVIMLTVSPVLHYPGDLLLNSRSKARLLDAVYDIAETQPQVVYFPAWEMMNYELRDYRFYGDDMLHPSKLAEKLVLERFLDSCCDADAKALFLQQEDRRRRSCHIPQNVFSVDHGSETNNSVSD